MVCLAAKVRASMRLTKSASSAAARTGLPLPRGEKRRPRTPAISLRMVHSGVLLPLESHHRRASQILTALSWKPVATVRPSSDQSQAKP
ncbi:hypothetical protein CDD83_10484 [Cordyceps sp. RAO-2017]|nr:hypothetical protein CDD83_10484 [Cordyceps sp. RAO-2017]